MAGEVYLSDAEDSQADDGFFISNPGEFFTFYQDGFKYQLKGEIEYDDQKYYEKCLRLKEELNFSELTFLGETETFDYYDWLDIVVLTSKSEALPFVLLEAMSNGKPVIPTNVGGCSELVNGYQDELGLAGLLCEVENPQAVAEAMLALGHKEKLRSEMGRTGSFRINSYYSEEKMLRAYRGLYNRLIREN